MSEIERYRVKYYNGNEDFANKLSRKELIKVLNNEENRVYFITVDII